MKSWTLRKTKSQNPEKKQEKKNDILKNLYELFDGRALDAFKIEKFPVQTTAKGFLNFDYSKIKILTPNQRLQRLPIAFAQVKTDNNSESLLYQSKEITEKVYNNINKSLLYQVLVFTIHGKTKKSFNNDKCKISAPTWDHGVEQHNGSY